MVLNSIKGGLTAIAAIILTIFIVNKLVSNVDYSSAAQASSNAEDDNFYLTGKFGTMNECLQSAYNSLKKRGLHHELISDKPKRVTGIIIDANGQEIQGKNSTFSCNKRESGTEGIYHELVLFLPPEYRDK